MEDYKSLNRKTIQKNILFFIVFLSILQIFFSNFFVCGIIPLKFCEIVNLSTIFFDLFFLVVFIVKLVRSIANKQFLQYFFYNNGYIEFFVSVPMIIFVSIPTLLIYLRVHDVIVTDNSWMSFAKICYSSTCVRSYKFIRVIHCVDCLDWQLLKMTNRSFQKVMHTILLSVIICLCSYNLGKDCGAIPSTFIEAQKNETCIMNSIIKQHEMLNSDFEPFLSSYVSSFPNVYGVIYNKKWIYQSKEAQNNTLSAKEIYYENMYNYLTAFDDTLFVFFSRKDLYEDLAINDMLILIFMLTTIMLIHLYLFYYEENVVKTAKQMYESMSQKWNVNKIEINPYYKDDEIFLLAKEFNKRWIPAKIKTLIANEPDYTFDGTNFKKINKNVLEQADKDSQ